MVLVNGTVVSSQNSKLFLSSTTIKVDDVQNLKVVTEAFLAKTDKTRKLAVDEVLVQIRDGRAAVPVDHTQIDMDCLCDINVRDAKDVHDVFWYLILVLVNKMSNMEVIKTSGM